MPIPTSSKTPATDSPSFSSSRRAAGQFGLPLCVSDILLVSKLAGVPDALIFFCFFSCIKARKDDHKARKIFPMRTSFLSSRKEKKQKKLKPSTEGREVWPGTSRIAESPQFGWRYTSKHVPSQTWLASLMPRSSFASFLLSREEKKIRKPERSCIKRIKSATP